MNVRKFGLPLCINLNVVTLRIIRDLQILIIPSRPRGLFTIRRFERQFVGNVRKRVAVTKSE